MSRYQVADIEPKINMYPPSRDYLKPFGIAARAALWAAIDAAVEATRAIERDWQLNRL